MEVHFKITATQTDATLSQNNGTITVTAIGGTGFKYSLNGGAFQDSGYFSEACRPLAIIMLLEKTQLVVPIQYRYKLVLLIPARVLPLMLHLQKLMLHQICRMDLLLQLQLVEQDLSTV